MRALFVVVGLISGSAWAAAGAAWQPGDVLLGELSTAGAQSPLGRDLLAASGQSLGVAQARPLRWWTTRSSCCASRCW